jgi:hypothetical protein
MIHVRSPRRELGHPRVRETSFIMLHTTTLWLALSIRKTTEFRPKSPLLLPSEGQEGSPSSQQQKPPFAAWGGFAFAA